MRRKYVLNEYFSRDFRICVLVFCRARSVMTFFIEFVNDRVYDIVIVSVK